MGTIDEENNRSYLVCDSCKGYYELQEGESPEDFSDKCECGGKLEYIKKIERSEDNIKKKNSSTVNDKIGKINLKSVGIGAVLSSILLILILSIGKLFLNYQEDYLTGAMVVMLILAPLIGGFTSSYLCGKCNYKYGILNSIISILLYNLVVLVFNVFYLKTTIDMSSYIFIAFLIEICGIIGGVLGIFIKNR